MEHVVFYSEDSGQSEFRRVGDLESAVRLVESLRNERGIADVTVHALTPVPVSFRTYYRVEVAAAEPSTEPDPSTDEPAAFDGVTALAVPRLADDPRTAPVLLAVPALLDDAADDDGLLAPVDHPDHADDADDAAAYGTLTSLSYEPIEAVAADADSEPDLEPQPEPLEAQASSDELEGLVPDSRTEPQAERSLGYFAR